MGLKRDPALAAAIAEISTAQIRSTDSALVSFGTRHTMSDTLSNSRGIGAARRYLFNKLTGYSKACGGCLKVEYDPAMMEMRGHPQRPMVNIVNVIAWLPGRDTSRVVVMGGHYDSCICARTDLGPLARFEATQDAPGADDDGSGTSAVVELARVFSKNFPRGLDASIIFVAYSGDEEGLYGSLSPTISSATSSPRTAPSILRAPEFSAPSPTTVPAASWRDTHGRRAPSMIPRFRSFPFSG